jgi:hypothetical protein
MKTKEKVQFQEVVLPNKFADKAKKPYDAYALAFVYTPEGNFLIKGFVTEIKEYLKSKHPRYFGSFNLYHKGKKRTLWYFGDNGFIISPRRENGYYTSKSKYWRFKLYGFTKTIQFKKLPNKWVSILDTLYTDNKIQ